MRTAAKKELEVRTEVAGPTTVRIIDATLDGHGFEYAMTKRLESAIRASGVPVNTVDFPKTPAEFFDALATRDSSNTLILVAHGEVERPGCWARVRAWVSRLRGTEPALRVEVAGMVCPWQLLGNAEADLTDKMIFLAVCGGHCPDSTWTWVTNQHLALLLVASRRSVTSHEVLEVFPKALQELKNSRAIAPEDLDTAVKKHDPTRAFEVFSGVGLVRGE